MRNDCLSFAGYANGCLWLREIDRDYSPDDFHLLILRFSILVETCSLTKSTLGTLTASRSYG